jgi:hypothetical protein
MTRGCEGHGCVFLPWNGEVMARSVSLAIRISDASVGYARMCPRTSARADINSKNNKAK